MVHNSVNKVIVIGGENVGKKQLLKSLLGEAHGEYASTEHAGVNTHSWAISTKYYTATLNFWLVSSEAFNRSLADADLITSLFDKCEGLVMVFDQTQPESFVKLQRWFSLMTRLAATPNVLLCIAGKKDLVTVPQTFVADAFSWCLDNHFELVEANCTLPFSHDDDEGLSRVHEALHTNMWSDLTMQKQTGTGGRVPLAQRAAMRDLSDDVAAFNATDTDLAASAAEAVPSSDARPSSMIETQLPAVVRFLAGAEFAESAEATAAEAGDREETGSFEPGENVALIDDFEQSIQQLQAMKQKAESMNPDARREMAASVAMMFWKQMGGGDDADGMDEFLSILKEADEDIKSSGRRK